MHVRSPAKKCRSTAVKKGPRRFLGDDESSLPRLMSSFCRTARALNHTTQRAHSTHAWLKEFLKLVQYFSVGTSGAPVATQPLRITLVQTSTIRENKVCCICLFTRAKCCLMIMVKIRSGTGVVSARFVSLLSCRASRLAPLTNLTLTHLARRLPRAASHRPRRAQRQAHWPRCADRGRRAQSRPFGRRDRQTRGHASRVARGFAFVTFEHRKASSAQVCVAAAIPISLLSINTISLHLKTPKNHTGIASCSVMLPWFRAISLFSLSSICTLYASKITT